MCWHRVASRLPSPKFLPHHSRGNRKVTGQHAPQSGDTPNRTQVDIAGTIPIMVSVTFHSDMVTLVVEGDDCCAVSVEIIESCECEVVDWFHHGVSCCIRLLSSYLEIHDYSTARDWHL